MLHPDIHNDHDQNDYGDQNDSTLPYQPVPQQSYHANEPEVEAAYIPHSHNQLTSEEPIYPPSPQLYQQPAASSDPTEQAMPQSYSYPQATAPSQGNYRPKMYAPAQRPPSRGLRAGALLLLSLLLAVVFGVGLFAGWQFSRTNPLAQPPSYNALQPGTHQQQATVPALGDNNIQTVRETVISNVSPAVVQINVTTANGSALGSGVIIDKRGYIVTNNHVVAGARSIDEVVLYDGTKVRNAKLVGVDPADDLAIIKIDPSNNMVVANIGDSSKLRVGQEVLAIGNPLGNTQTVTNGIVSALGRNVSEGNGGATIPNAIQTDAPINPGNSGGALVDLQGNLVGIPTLTAIDPEFNAPANGVGFAIPSNRVSFIAPQIIQDGKVTHTGRAALNVRVTSVNATVKAQANLAVDHGILITELVSGGAAQKAGLQVGDVIVQIDAKAIDAIPSLEDALISKNPGDRVSVQVYRGNQQLTISVTLGELQSA